MIYTTYFYMYIMAAFILFYSAYHLTISYSNVCQLHCSIEFRNFNIC